MLLGAMGRALPARQGFEARDDKGSWLLLSGRPLFDDPAGALSEGASAAARLLSILDAHGVAGLGRVVEGTVVARPAVFVGAGDAGGGAGAGGLGEHPDSSTSSSSAPWGWPMARR